VIENANECLNESSYPLVKQGDQLSELVRLVSVIKSINKQLHPRIGVQPRPSLIAYLRIQETENTDDKREQIQQCAFLQVGQDAAVAAVQVQVQLVDTQVARRLETVPGRQELGLLLEYLADGLLVEARGIGHVGVEVVEGLFLNVTVKPSSHAMVVYHGREGWVKRLSASPGSVPAAHSPKGLPCCHG